MDLQVFEVQVCAIAEARGHFISAILNYFKANQMGFEQAFDNLTVKHMDALRKQIIE